MAHHVLWGATLIKVPGDGACTLRLRSEASTFHRHAKKSGLRYREPVEVEFTEARVETGQKKS